MTEQAFIRALNQAVDAQDDQEAARLVREHTQALEAFPERCWPNWHLSQMR